MPPSKSEERPRLSVSANPVEDESLPGLLMRVAGRARFSKARRLADLAGVRQPASAITDDDLGELAALIGTDPELLEKTAYRPAQRRSHHRYLGCVIHRDFLLLGHRRFCPQCLTEAAYHRMLWDFVLLTACPDHSVRLVAGCPKCGRQLGWQFPEVAVCSCGADLRDAACETVSEKEVAACRDLRELVTANVVPWLPSKFAACERSDVVRLIMCLGMFMTDWSRRRRPVMLFTADPDAAARIVVAGIRALREWPEPIHSFLNEQKQNAETQRHRFGARRVMGTFYTWLTQMEEGPIRDALVAVAAAYVAQDPSLIRLTHRSRLVGQHGKRSLIGLNEASEILVCSGERVKKMMEAGILDSVASKGRGIPMLIDCAAVEAVAAAEAGAVDLTQAAKLLGISKSRTRCLLDAGVLKHLRKATESGWNAWAIASTDVEDLLTRAESSVRSGCAAKRAIGLNETADRFRIRGIDFAELIKMILDERVPVVAIDMKRVGLQRLRFDAAEMKQICRGWENDSSVTIQRAAERLRIHWEVVANLVARGFLLATNGRIRSVDFDRFVTEYVSGAILACEHGTSPRNLAEQLAKRGVFPVVGPGVDGSRQNFYRRIDCCRVW